MNAVTIIHLDDDPLELRHLKRMLERSKQLHNTEVEIFSCSQITDFKSHLEQIQKVDVVILDIHLSSQETNLAEYESGISLVSLVRKHHPHSVILMSSNLDDPQNVLKSLRVGADEFLSKKTIDEQFLGKLLSIRKSALLKRGLFSDHILDEKRNTKIPIVGSLMEKIAGRIPQIIRSAICSVYIEGESGTGKEVVVDLFAALLGNVPFVKLNCGTISQSLLESELFGHAKGSFTGALTDKQGMIEAASGGWLFLDEISSLSEGAQVALLRALENQEVIRLGETKARKINVRFLAASNVPLQQLVEKGLFRNDLWQRLRETEIILTPLRERQEEIADLAKLFCQTMQGGPYSIDETALNILRQLPWKEGNVRELRNCLRAMTEHNHNRVLSPMGIPERILNSAPCQMGSTVQDKNEPECGVFVPLKNSQGDLLTYNEMEDVFFTSLINKIEETEGKINITKLAQKLNVARSTLQAKMKKISINP